MNRCFVSLALEHRPPLLGITPQAARQNFCDFLMKTSMPLISVLRDLESLGAGVTIDLVLSTAYLDALTKPSYMETCRENIEAVITANTQLYDDHRDSEIHGPIALADLERARSIQSLFLAINGNVLGEYSRLAANGIVNLLTRPATADDLPALMFDDGAIERQISFAAEFHARLLGSRPVGISLLGCGYSPSFDRIIARQGFRYVLLDAHGFEGASSRPAYGAFGPLHSPGTGVANFAAHPDFLDVEFSEEADPRADYRLIGRDSLLSLPGRQDVSAGRRGLIGELPGFYEPARARSAAFKHCQTWLENIGKILKVRRDTFDRSVHLLGVFNASYFTTDWFEGPLFLRELAKQCSAHPELTWSGPAAFLDETPTNQSGWPGTKLATVSDTGLESWLFPAWHWASETLSHADQCTDASPRDELCVRILSQGQRELLLAQHQEAVRSAHPDDVLQGAVAELREHIGAVHRLASMVENRQDVTDDDLHWLTERETKSALLLRPAHLQDSAEGAIG